MNGYVFLVAAVSGSFLLSALLKLAQPAPFRLFLDTVIADATSTRTAARALPALEFVIGIALLSPISRWAAVGAATLSFAFLAVGLRAVRMSPGPGCGCFGALDATTPHWLTLVRAVGLAAAAVGCFALSFSNGARISTGSGFILVAGLLAGVGLALSTTLLGRLIAFRRTLRPLLLGTINERGRGA
jgi:hypothetical protein